MSGFAWCRFCGGIGISDQMVCASQECMGRELAESVLHGMVVTFADQEFKLPGATRTIRGTNILAGSRSSSLHSVGQAVDVNTHVVGHSGHVHVNAGTPDAWQISNTQS